MAPGAGNAGCRAGRAGVTEPVVSTATEDIKDRPPLSRRAWTRGERRPEAWLGPGGEPRSDATPLGNTRTSKYCLASRLLEVATGLVKPARGGLPQGHGGRQASRTPVWRSQPHGVPHLLYDFGLTHVVRCSLLEGQAPRGWALLHRAVEWRPSHVTGGVWAIALTEPIPPYVTSNS